MVGYSGAQCIVDVLGGDAQQQQLVVDMLKGGERCRGGCGGCCIHVALKRLGGCDVRWWVCECDTCTCSSVFRRVSMSACTSIVVAFLAADSAALCCIVTLAFVT